MLLSRRAMLGVTAGLFSWAYMPRFAEAASADPRLLIVILRGGLDGINCVIPFGDPAYNGMRGGIAIPQSSTIPLDSFFGLHPALPSFGSMFQAGDAAVVHATCVPLRNRSHFDCQDNLESGLPGMISPNSTGWLNRLLSALPAGAPLVQHGAIEISEAPLILRGPAPVLGWSSTWYEPVDTQTLNLIRSLYAKNDVEMSAMLERGLKANALAKGVGGDDGDVSYLRKAFRGAGRLIAADDGPRIAVLSVEGWDTHADQGAATGYLADVMVELDQAIADFKDAVGSAWGNTAMVMATEFGRTVHVNGDGGTDHGVGTVALLAGGAVNGGHVFADWPGIGQNQLYEDSDLAPTTDLRAVFKGVLQDHLGVPRSLLNKTIFPESAPIVPYKHLIKTSAPAQPVATANVSARPEQPIARYRRLQQAAQAPA
jgi:uncharacterized protein (DUF1501 family)